MLAFNKFKKHIAILITLVIFLNFGLNVKNSDAAIPVLVYYGLGAVLTAAGLAVETGHADDLIYAIEGYWDYMNDWQQSYYENAATLAQRDGNFALHDEMWNHALKYVNETFDEGINTINVPPSEYGSISSGIQYDLSTVIINSLPITFTDIDHYHSGTCNHAFDICIGEYVLDTISLIRGIKFCNESDIFSINWIKLEFTTNGINIIYSMSVSPDSNWTSNREYTYNEIKQLLGVTALELLYGEPEVYEINVTPISPQEFNSTSPVPDGMTPERRIAVPPSVFGANTPEEAVSGLTGKTAVDIWGAEGAYPENSTTFDPVEPNNPIVPWIPITEPSTFTPAGDQAAQITATAPTNLQGSNTDLNSISGSIGSIWDLLKTGFEALIDTIWTGISHLLEGLQSISLSLTNIFGLINTGVSAIVGAISSIWDIVFEGFASLAQALRNLLDKTAEIANTLNPASDTFFLRVACVPDAAVLQGFADSINNNLNNKFQFLDIYQEIQNNSNSDSNNEFQDIYVNLPVFGNQKIVEADYVNTAGAYFKNILIAFVGFLTVIFTFKRWANIGSV